MQAGPRAVLIVEDESIVARDLQQTLVGLGYDAFAIASSADEAIASASEKCPDLVLMDIRIKGRLDGISTAELLKARFDIPVVYLTAHADDATLERAKRTEPHGYVLKPVRSADLRSAVEVALYKHEMEKRLRERERWFSATLQSIGDAVVTVDLSGRITFMNPVAETLTGWKVEDALRRPVRDVVRLVDEKAKDIDDTPVERALRENRPLELRDAGLHNAADGRVRAIDDSTAVVMDDDRPLGAVMVFRDVTEKKQLQSQLELAQRLASLGTMAAGVAHEVNNPLGVIMVGAETVAAELARQDADLSAGLNVPRDEQVRRLERTIRTMSIIQSAVRRISSIVSQLQAFARPRPETTGRASVVRVLEWALSTTSQELRHRARVVTNLSPVPPVRADENRLGQVAINLLVNAAQAIAPGNVEHNEVSIATRTDERGWVVMEVRDTGEGISADNLKRIFDPFFTTKPVGDGTGLGLSICHGIVTSLGGEMTVESRVGEGTVFRVFLPPAPIEENSPVLPPETPHAIVKGRILIIDDEENLLQVFADTLDEHEVVCASRAKEALRLLEDGERFDVICCDLMMPEMTGIDLYEALLSSRPDDAHRMIFMSGGAITVRGDDFLRSVPNRSLKKPFSGETLQRVLQEVLREKA